MSRITTDAGDVEWPDALLKPLCEAAADVVVHRRMTVPEREIEGMLIDVGTMGLAYGTIRIRSGGYVHTIRESLAVKLLEEHPEFRPAQTLVTAPTTSWASSVDNFGSNVSYTDSSVTSSPAAVAVESSPAAEGFKEWFVNANNRSEGPFAAVDIIRMVGERILTAATGIWRKGEDAWTPIGQHPEFRAALSGGAGRENLADVDLDALIAQIRMRLMGTNRVLKPEEIVQFRDWINAYIEQGSAPLIQESFRRLLDSPETPAILKARLIQQIGALAIPELAEAVDRALEQKALKAFTENPELRRAIEIARRTIKLG